MVYLTREVMYRKVTLMYLHITNVAVKKAVSFKYLVILYAKRMRRIILSSVACLAITHFSTLFHIGTIFGKIIEIKCVFIPCTTSKHFCSQEECSITLLQM